MSGTPRSSILTTDVAVIGAGVAGSSLAAVLAAAGLGVVIIEREARFRDRVRGEGIHPWGVRELQSLGLDSVLNAAGAQELPIRCFYANRVSSEPVRWDSAGPNVPSEWGIYHPALQDALLAHAALGGVRVLRPARVTRFSRAQHAELEVTAEDAEYTVRSRLVIGADGRQSAARRWVGSKTIYEPVTHQVGGCLLDNVVLSDDTNHIGDFDGGGVLVFPQGSGRARTYVIAKDSVVGPLRGHDHAAAFIALCASAFPEGEFGDAQAAGPLAFFPNADVWSDRLYDDRVALIGDAAGANDPSGGHGLSLCFRDVREVRDQLLGDSDWDAAMTAYADARTRYYAVLREFMKWVAPLSTDTGPEVNALREGNQRARQVDPTLGGFSQLTVTGPDGLDPTDDARRHFFGEDLG